MEKITEASRNYSFTISNKDNVEEIERIIEKFYDEANKQKNSQVVVSIAILDKLQSAK